MTLQKILDWIFFIIISVFALGCLFLGIGSIIYHIWFPAIFCTLLGVVYVPLSIQFYIDIVKYEWD